MSRKRQRSSVTLARPGQYPSLAERERLVERRTTILRKLIAILVSYKGAAVDREMQALGREYPPVEVDFVMRVFRRNNAAHDDFINDEAASYRHYRRAFARFGGSRPFLSASEHGDLQMEHAKLNMVRTFHSEPPPPREPRERELTDLLLVDADYFEDLAPLAIPARPADFVAPAPGEYAPPAQALLGWGWDLDVERCQREAIRNGDRWLRAFPDLARMALDPGLLRGWPGERASWAPYHALHLLGVLQAADYARQLLALLDEPNDWLSDQLPRVWAPMGAEVEATLWAYADDRHRSPGQRAVALKGLAFVAQTSPARRAAIVRDFITRLEQSTPFDAKINSYRIHLLDFRLHAFEARAAIRAAFEKQKVDSSIIRRDDVDMLAGEEE